MTSVPGRLNTRRPFHRGTRGDDPGGRPKRLRLSAKQNRYGDLLWGRDFLAAGSIGAGAAGSLLRGPSFIHSRLRGRPVEPSSR
jgi:hypothetical protein